MEPANLFSQAAAPLPHKLRPQSFADFSGQKEVLKSLQGAPLHSMILYGPPGCGKTTLARIIASEGKLPFHALSAVSSGVKDVREVLEKARQVGQAILFIDEIHRFSKSQQDSLLHAVEAGEIVLIGATTEHPAFEVISPLLSRCQVYRLKPLEDDDLNSILNRALAYLADFSISDKNRRLLIEASAGDARKLLRILEQACSSVTANAETENREILAEHINAAVQNNLRNYDRAGENHYDFISAFIKSLRGSDPDAALLYMAAMIEAGEDPLFIARRMLIFASEDIGNAYPQALQMALAAFQAIERIGMPEGRIILGQCATLLASSPKSNASYLAIDRALAAVKGKVISIPDHLRNAPTAIHKKEGASKGYRYPHDAPGHFIDESYLPAGFEKACFYFPTEQGQEIKLKDRLQSLRPDRY